MLVCSLAGRYVDARARVDRLVAAVSVGEQQNLMLCTGLLQKKRHLSYLFDVSRVCERHIKLINANEAQDQQHVPRGQHAVRVGKTARSSRRRERMSFAMGAAI